MGYQRRRWAKLLAGAIAVGFAAGYLASWTTPCFPDHGTKKEGENGTVDTNENCHVSSMVVRDVWQWTADNKEPIEALSVLFTGIFTGALVWATVLLWKAGERQIKAATRAAEAAGRSAEVAERALTDLERPHVYVLIPRHMLAHAVSQNANGVEPNIAMSIKNYGRTPAIIHHIGARLIIDGDDKILPVLQTGPIVLEQGQHDIRTIGYDGALSPGIATTIRDGLIAFWFVFNVEYRDIFGVEHQTGGEWRYFIRIDQFGPPDGGPQDIHT